MNRERKGKRLTAFLLAVLMMISTVFCTEIPVSAATVRNQRITSEIQASSTKALRIKWNSSPLAKGYVIYRRESVKHRFKKIKTVSKNTTSYLDRNLVSGKAYQYAVRAYRKEGGRNIYSVYTPAIGATRPQSTVPRIKSTSYSNRINVFWNQVRRTDGYMIYRKETGGKWKFVADVPKTRKSYADKTVEGGTEYIYCVRPYKKSGGKKYMAALKRSNAVTTPIDTSSDNTSFTSAQKDVMKKILYAVETGGQVYGNQDYADFTQAYTNSGAEHAITIGAGQWYATEAQRLLKLIHTKSPATWKKYDPKNYVWNDVVKKDWSTYKLKETSGRAKIIVKLISSPAGIKCQDQLMYEQINEMEAEIRKLGITDDKAVGMFINIRHQGGYGAVTRVLKKTKRPVTLGNIYKALQTDTGNQVGTYRTRQNKVYTWLNKYM